jgi:hypothetical protein
LEAGTRRIDALSSAKAEELSLFNCSAVVDETFLVRRRLRRSVPPDDKANQDDDDKQDEPEEPIGRRYDYMALFRAAAVQEHNTAAKTRVDIFAHDLMLAGIPVILT